LNRLDHAVEIARYFAIGEPGDAEALAFDKRGAFRIARFLAGVRVAVHLDRQPCLKAQNIHEIRPDRCLMPPFELRQRLA